MAWVALEGGCFRMGENSIYPEEGPEHQACVEAFEITATEITNAQFAAFIDETGYLTRAERGWRADEEGGPKIDLPPSSAIFQVPDGQARDLNWWKLQEGANWQNPLGSERSGRPNPEHPVVHITFEDAAAFADWAGGRLPTETEWEYAARGGNEGEILPWAKEEITSKANTWQGIFPMVNSAEDGFIGLAPVASYEANPFGLYDMFGNVWELTASSYYPGHSQSRTEGRFPQGYDPGQPGLPVTVIKGGSFLCAPSYCYRYRPAARQAQDLAFGTNHIGFRIVRDAQ